MGDWGYVTFFRTRDLDALERALGDLCLAEGLVAAPYVRRKRETWDRMQYGCGATSDRWALADSAGLEPLACSASGARCLARVSAGHLFVGRRA